MDNKSVRFSSIDQYIATFPETTRVILESLRAAIHAASPEASETISYQMPAFAMNGILVYFAAHNNHIGFYPTASGMQAFAAELSAYETSKGAIRFPIEHPLPLDLISQIVKFRVAENFQRAQAKTAKRKSVSSKT